MLMLSIHYLLMSLQFENLRFEYFAYLMQLYKGQYQHYENNEIFVMHFKRHLLPLTIRDDEYSTYSSYLIAKTARYFVPEYLLPNMSIPIIILAISDPARNIMCNGIGMSKLNAQLFTTLTPKYIITI